MKIEPSSPAFPRPHTEICEGSSGLPIRLHLAAMMWHDAVEVVWSWEKVARTSDPYKLVAEQAMEMALALIAEYNRTESKP